MKVLIQNLQKKPGLATELLLEHSPDVMLAQEIDFLSEKNHSDDNANGSYAHNTSKLGYGTAIHSSDRNKNCHPITDIHLIDSPYTEFGGLIRKKTTIGTIEGIQFVSFHGYNGTPFKSIDKLVAHVQAVVEVLSPAAAHPAVFAGDFNTWTQEHLNAVKTTLEKAGFNLAYSWPYPGRDFPLDHAFVRGVEIREASFYHCTSDHNGALLELKK
mmetsp:Transcript_3403/g.4550  ORF Transcript_3403/g.4550 Transcript_3403/m.4550 type:complete len:214 (+) Transcript_3403:95-736(+)